MVEFFYTLLLAFVVLSTACYSKAAGNQYFGLAIGFVIVAGGYGGGAISGGAFNPAVAIGLGPHPNSWAYSYAAVELIAGASAAVVFMIVRRDDYEDGWVATLPTKLLSEFIGTFYLCFTVGLNVYVGSKAAALSIAASLMCVIYALGSVSGAHFNPAVTVAVLASARDLITTADALLYIGAQCFGGVAAMLLALSLADPRSMGHLGPPPGAKDAVGEPVGLRDCLDEEFMFTFGLAFTVLATATTRKPMTHMFGLAIGFCVVVGGEAVLYSGGALNPAVALSLEVASSVYWSKQPSCGDAGCFYWSSLGGYVVWELLAGVFAALIFRFTHTDEYRDIAYLDDYKSEKTALVDETPPLAEEA